MHASKKNPFKQYFADIWAGIRTTWVGMSLTLRYCLGKPVTMCYPEVRPQIPESYRGLHGYEEAKCISCKACAQACPVDCISIEAAGRGKDSMLTRFDIDYSRCLFCELCTVACPTGCLWMTTQYDLARSTREECVLHFARPKTAEEVAEHLAKLAQKEAEKKAAKAAAAQTESKPEAKPVAAAES